MLRARQVQRPQPQRQMSREDGKRALFGHLAAIAGAALRQAAQRPAGPGCGGCADEAAKLRAARQKGS